ncbi:hypothetical protein V5799_000219, partial [Amblyomma americanum]
NCNFLDEHLEGAINTFINKLPLERKYRIKVDTKLPEELSKREFKILNLNSRRPFGPFLTYCRNGRKFVQFDLVNIRPLLLIGAFPGNDSFTYNLMESRALLVRFTAQFEVEGSKEDVKLRPITNLPMSMLGVVTTFENVDAKTNKDLGIVRAQPVSVRNVWQGILNLELYKLFAELLQEK